MGRYEIKIVENCINKGTKTTFKKFKNKIFNLFSIYFVIISGRATKRGLNGRATKGKKSFFFFNVRKKVLLWPLIRGGGLKAVVAGPLRKELFCGFPISVECLSCRI